MSRFRFQIAKPGDDAELREFASKISMPGAIQLSSEREPSYFDALAVEGSASEVLICRDEQTGRVVATGNRSIKSMFVNGKPVPVGYLSGLRIDEAARNGRVLYAGYQFLREIHEDGRAPFYLTTIMEGNVAAKNLFVKARSGLPHYHDCGRFECMAFSFRRRSAEAPSRSGISIRPATAGDARMLVDFLQSQGKSRQFFPVYQTDDFASLNGLLKGLFWKSVFLAFEDGELVGTMAAWDQRHFRQWSISGYGGWTRLMRLPYNLMAQISGMPRLPRAGAVLNFFILSLICVRKDDRGVFCALLDEIVRQEEAHYSFFLAGMHESDSLLQEMRGFSQYFPFPSRLYVVSWEENEDWFKKLEPNRTPYLELGSL